MSNNKQQPKTENLNNQFSNTEPLTHAQRVAIVNKMSNNKQIMKLYTEEQLINTVEAIREYIKNYPEKFHESMIEKHLKNLAPLATKRTLIIYNTKETTEDEARHLLEILNCDDSTLWDNADHCGVQVLEVPIQGGNNEQQ